MTGCSPSAGIPSGCSCTCWPRRSGSAAALHIRSRTVRGRAVMGALTGISALAALFLGVLLAG
ncbi:MAG: hypothetical protein ACRDNT_18130 [Streptosporangiaceae bacterium]